MLSACLAAPVAAAQSFSLPMFSILKAMMWPLPISPSRLSLGITQFSKKSCLVLDPLIPILCSSSPKVRPGVPRSTMNALNLSPSTLANTVNTSAKPALVIHIFCPLMA